MKQVSTTFVLTAILVLFGATVSSMAGFGFNIVIMPFLLMLYPAKTAVALSLCVALCGVLLQWLRVRQHVNYGLTLRLCVGALFGVPLGTLVLTLVTAATLKLLVGLSVLTAVIVTVVRRQDPDLPLPAPRTASVMITGFLSGLLAGSVGQAGTPVALLMARTGLDKAVVRATLVTFFVAVDFGALVALERTGVLTGEIVRTAAWLVPAYAVGLMLGDYGFKRSNQGTYRRLVLGVLSTAAVIGVVNGLTALR